MIFSRNEEVISDAPPRDVSIGPEGDVSKGKCRERLINFASKVASSAFESDLLETCESSDTRFEFGGTDSAAGVENEFLHELRSSDRIEHGWDCVGTPVVLFTFSDQNEFGRRASVEESFVVWNPIKRSSELQALEGCQSERRRRVR